MKRRPIEQQDVGYVHVSTTMPNDREARQNQVQAEEVAKRHASAGRTRRYRDVHRGASIAMISGG